MISPGNFYIQLKRFSENGRLVPFYKAVGVYFIVGGGAAPSLSTAALKCAPVLCLLLCVLLKVRSLTPPEKRYGRCVALGLALSAVGDALLVWETLLIHGIVAFACAHAAYLCAFGLKPKAWRSGILLMTAAMVFPILLNPPNWLAYPVRAYSLLLGAMAWRGTARPGYQRAGTLFFLLSDAILGYGLFGGDLPYQQALVMSTYYLGQLGIALSALKQSRRLATR